MEVCKIYDLNGDLVMKKRYTEEQIIKVIKQKSRLKVAA
jgi:hypothetical protein